MPVVRSPKKLGGAPALARLFAYAAFAGVCATSGATAARAQSAAPAAPAGEAATPDLGAVRYRDPTGRREVWLGLDVGGVALPRRLGLFDRRIWVARVSPAWAVALTPWLAVGGRHGIGWYEAAGNGTTARLRQHEHQVEISGQPLAAWGHPRHRDRLALGVSTHAIKKIQIDAASFRVGGLQDTVAHLGYGIEHRLAPRWALGWRAQLRHAWVFLSKQRQLRGSVRVSFAPRERHELSLEALAYYVNRDADQAGTPTARNTVHGQFAGEYVWMSRAGVGLSLRGRFSTSYLAGEAPVYEVRDEALSTYYGDLTLGLRAVWR